MLAQTMAVIEEAVVGANGVSNRKVGTETSLALLQQRIAATAMSKDATTLEWHHHPRREAAEEWDVDKPLPQTDAGNTLTTRDTPIARRVAVIEMVAVKHRTVVMISEHVAMVEEVPIEKLQQRHFRAMEGTMAAMVLSADTVRTLVGSHTMIRSLRPVADSAWAGDD